MRAPPIVTIAFLLALPVTCQYHKVPSMQGRKGGFLGDLSIAMQCNKVCHTCIETQCPMPWVGPCNVRYANAAGCPTSPAARGSPMSPPEQQEMLGLHTAHTERTLTSVTESATQHCTASSVIESAEEEERLVAHCRGLLLLLLLLLLPDCCGLVTVHCFQLFFIVQICIEFTTHVM